MNMKTFFTLLALSLGLVGTIFISKGILLKTPRYMAEVSATKFGYNKDILTDLALSKADMLIGFSIIILVFTIQILNISLIPETCPFIESKQMSFTLLIFIFLTFFLIASPISHGFKKYFFKEAAVIMVRENLDESIKNNKGILRKKYSYLSITNYAQDLLNINRKREETDINLLKRIAQEVKYDLPLNVQIIEK